MKICILDDAAYICDILKGLLKEHEVLTFTEPEPFKAAVDSTVDVIITDLRVSRYDAIENIRRFKTSNITVKIIVMSAYFTEDHYLALIDCHIFKAVKKNTEFQWFEEIVEAVNR